MEKIRTSRSEWQSGIAKNITFIVTKDCQLACKYCYLVGKNTKERMSWEVAKHAIDYVLDHEDEMKEESVIWDFIISPALDGRFALNLPSDDTIARPLRP